MIHAFFVGENIQFYPKGTHLIGVDWNIRLGEYLVKGNRSRQFSHVIIERLIVGDGSSLREVSTGCVDVVVTTRSLCSVRSVKGTLEEIYRVLAPVRNITWSFRYFLYFSTKSVYQRLPITEAFFFFQIYREERIFSWNTFRRQIFSYDGCK